MKGVLHGDLRRLLTASFLVAVLAKAFSLVGAALLAHRMDVTGFGRYAFAVALASVLGVPTMLGLPTLIVRLVSRYLTLNDWPRLRGLLERAALAVVVLSGLVAGIAAVIVLLLSGRLASDTAHSLWWAFAWLPTMSVTAVGAAALRGLGRIVPGQVVEGLIVPGLFVGFLVAWPHLADTASVLTPSGAIAARFGAQCIALALGLHLLLRYLPNRVRAARSIYQMRSWAASAAPLLLIGGLSVVNGRTDVIMLSLLKGPAAAGVYQASARGAELVIFALVVINLVIQPTLSRLHAQSDLEQLQSVVTSAARVAFAVAMPITLAFAIFGGAVLSRVFGPAYAAGALPLAILSVSQTVSAGMGSVGQILNMTGFERLAARGAAASALANVLLNLMLIPLWGTSGAAVATGVSLVLWNVVLGRYVRRRLGVAPSMLGPSRLGAR